MPKIKDDSKVVCQALLEIGGKSDISSIGRKLGKANNKTLHMRLKKVAAAGYIKKRDAGRGDKWSLTPKGRRLVEPKAAPKPTRAERVYQNWERLRALLSEETCPFCGEAGGLSMPDMDMPDTLSCGFCGALAEGIRKDDGMIFATIPGTGVKSFVAQSEGVCSECRMPFTVGTTRIIQLGAAKVYQHLVCPEVDTPLPAKQAKQATRLPDNMESTVQVARIDCLERGRWINAQDIMSTWQHYSARCRPPETDGLLVSVVSYMQKRARYGLCHTNDPAFRLGDTDIRWLIPKGDLDLTRTEVLRPGIRDRGPMTGGDALRMAMKSWMAAVPDPGIVGAVEAWKSNIRKFTPQLVLPICDGKPFYRVQLAQLLSCSTATATRAIDAWKDEGLVEQYAWRSPFAFRFLRPGVTPTTKKRYIEANQRAAEAVNLIQLQATGARHRVVETGGPTPDPSYAPKCEPPTPLTCDEEVHVPTFIGTAGTMKTPGCEGRPAGSPKSQEREVFDNPRDEIRALQAKLETKMSEMRKEKFTELVAGMLAKLDEWAGITSVIRIGVQAEEDGEVLWQKKLDLNNID